MTKVKDPVSIMKILVENGYNVNASGDWNHPHKYIFTVSKWQYCGKEPSPAHYWEPEWLEETVTLEDLVIDQPVRVRDSDDENWINRHFAGSHKGEILVWHYGRTSFTEISVTKYRYWKLPDEETK